MSHTQGKLKYEPAYKTGFVIWGGSNSIPVEIVSSCDDDGRWGAIKDVANARRLVAAWNWCDGLSTQNLEDNVPAKELAHRYNAVIAERDSLRAVNAELLEALVAITNQLERVGDTRPHKDGQFIDDARAAIASARKQGEQG